MAIPSSCSSRLLGASCMMDVFGRPSNRGALIMPTQTIVSPENIFNTLWGFQRTAALKTGIDLDIFTAIGEGDRTAAALAKKSGASERGIRILCDYLTIIGLLSKSGATYELTPESAMFLTKQS